MRAKFILKIISFYNLFNCEAIFIKTFIAITDKAAAATKNPEMNEVHPKLVKKKRYYNTSNDHFERKWIFVCWRLFSGGVI